MHKVINIPAISLVPEKENSFPEPGKKRLPDKGAIKNDNCFPSDKSVKRIAIEIA